MASSRSLISFARQCARATTTTGRLSATRPLSCLVSTTNAVAAPSSRILNQTLPCALVGCNSRSLVTSVCGMSAASGNDGDLSEFLSEEIEYEKDNLEQLPTRLRDFSVKVSGTEVKLSKSAGGETVVVSFDINENRNVDETPEGDEEAAGPIVSYPEFAVAITKRGGKTLNFTCVYEASELAEDGDDHDDHQHDDNLDMIKFEHVSVTDGADEAGAAGAAGVYESETTNMDPNLYCHLMDLMAERGIDGEFLQELLQYSTAIEHKHHVTFLQDLKSFVNNN